ncbi:hypothetical protein [Shewanella polaris]|uniref:Uncharacterized protein n=1 Tax=Shewanella polaris TaxID=2588449 RepID=A0A4Y5YDH8_9GAMM|nr:hypothetical protein [Shewanella polaris]QDE30755.1 hypothetical protein FH971_07130 [Shewanella polaris]
MKTLLLITAIIFPLFASASDICQSTTLMATYNIEPTTNDLAPNKQNQLVLLRAQNSVFHISNHEVATQWTTLPHNHMKKTSYFIDDKRAIEYEATKTISNQAWQYHAQLLHPLFQQQSTLIETTGQGCDKLEHYQQQTNTKTVDIWWFPAKKLVQRISTILSDKSGPADKAINWQLSEMTYDNKMIQQQLDTFSAYQSTDFADIGDNESDPFFRKMINLGFIEHSASGFYDSEGNSLSSAHQH